MNLKTLLFTKNPCYIKNQKMTPIGIMVHSTGANNPALKRYVGPDDGILGFNKNNNHWNMADVNVAVHAFIGKLEDGTIATYQTLPWTTRAWHCGSGTKGSGNNNMIGFEICEDSLTDRNYFDSVYKEAVELCAYLCKLYNIKVPNIICHSEGNKMGLASAHADVMHWFPKHNKTMDDFRNDVSKEIGNVVITVPTPIDVSNTSLPTLKRGDKGDAVRGLQNKLISKGYKLTVDGDFGISVESTVKDFQQKNKLSPDGIVGQNTWKLL